MAGKVQKGKDAELRAMDWLRRRGVRNLKRSPGSRGSSDITGQHRGKTILAQVKSSTLGLPSLSKNEQRRLRRKAQRGEGRALSMLIDDSGKRGRFEVTDLSTGRPFQPKVRKRRRRR